MASSAPCYYPDGSTSNDIPCENSPSACCSATSHCLTNGYCLSNLQVVRSSCTDKTWQSPVCPTLCIAEFADATATIRFCPGRNLWACNASACNAGIGGFMPPGDILLRDFEKSSLGLVTTAAPPPTAIATTLAGATITQQVESSDCQNQPDTNKLAGIGAGVGLPLLAAFLTTLFLLRRSMRIQKAMARERERPVSELPGSGGMVKGTEEVTHEMPENRLTLELPPQHVMAHEKSDDGIH